MKDRNDAEPGGRRLAAAMLSPALGFLVGLVPSLVLPGARAELAPLLCLPLIALGWAGTGGAVCALLRVETPLTIRLGLGAGTCSTLMFLGGLAGAYRWPLLAWWPLLLAPLGVRHLLDDLRRTGPASPAVHVIRAVHGMIASLLLLVIVVPTMDPDAMTYHLALPELWTATGQFVHVPTLHYSYFPLGAEQGFVMARLWLDPAPEKGWTLAQGMGLLHGLLLARGVASLVGRCEPTGAVPRELASLMVFTVPATLLVSGLPYNDAYGAALLILAVDQLLHWTEKPSNSRALILGLLLGFAMASKYTLVAAPPILIVALMLTIRTRQAPVAWLRGISVAAIGAVSVWLPWVAKTTLATGNPVYPFAFGIFGGMPDGAAAWDHAATAINRAAAGLGAGWNPTRWITAPLELWTDPLGFGLLPRIGPNLLLAAPFVLWVCLRGVRRERFLAVATVLFYVAWNVTSRNARFLIPALALALTVTVLCVTRLANEGRPWRLGAFAVVAALLTWNVTEATFVFSILLKPVAYLTGAESRESYLVSRRRPRQALRWASENLPADARVLLVGETRSLGLARDCLVGGALDPSPLLWLENRTESTGFVEAVQRSDLTHVIIDPAAAEDLASRRDRYRGRGTELPVLQEWLARETRLLFSGNGVSLYEIPPRASPR